MSLSKLLSPSFWVDRTVTFVLQVVLVVLLRILHVIKGEDVRVNREVTSEKRNSEKPKIPEKRQKARAIPKVAEESKTVNLVTGTPSELKPEEIVVPSELPIGKISKEEEVKSSSLETKPQEKEEKRDQELEIVYPPFEMKTAHGVTKKSDMIPIEFHWKYGGSRVFVTGDFDDWKAQEHEMNLDPSTNDFVAVVEIDRTKQHEFKFVVDGNWQCNWDFPTRYDEHGNVNNILYPNPVSPLSPDNAPFSSPMTATAY